MSAVVRDEGLGALVLGGEGLIVVEGRRDLLGKLLAKLDAPLVVGVDPLYAALDEGDVLVKRDQRS